MRNEEIRGLSPPTTRWLNFLILGSGFFLAALQLGWIPFFRHAWAVNLWAYQPLAPGLLAIALAWLMTSSSIRQFLIHSWSRIQNPLDQKEILAPVSGIIVSVILWIFRDGGLSPDAKVFGGAILSGYQFIFPDVGTTWIIFGLNGFTNALGQSDFLLVRLISCAAGGLTVGLLVSLARRGMLGPIRPFGLAAGLVLSSGLIRVFAGRVEAYPLLLAGMASYCWLALRYLKEERGWYLTCLVAGITVWLHAAAVGLAVSLFFLPRLAQKDLPWSHWFGLLARGAMVAAGPSIVFYLGLMFLGNEMTIEATWNRVIEILGGNETETATRWWVRGRGEAPSIGTDVVLGSWAQFKYLGNAAFLLCPSAIPVLGVLMATQGRELVRDRTFLFLAALCLPLVLYSFALRPFWGPYDWDLFSITALSLILLQAYGLNRILKTPLRQHVAVGLVGLQFLFVGAPFFALGFSPLRDAGPFFIHGYLEAQIGQANTPPPPALAPWL
ncbi:MAG: hypothetical protein CMN75_00660 [Spirochaeta sp.]|nr:hypothetical protein [Spirochaeta sp.]RPG07069.1 MAG: hypothetical protein CBC32_010330 [Proteobacteria bacterium TMED72]